MTAKTILNILSESIKKWGDYNLLRHYETILPLVFALSKQEEREREKKRRKALKRLNRIPKYEREDYLAKKWYWTDWRLKNNFNLVAHVFLSKCQIRDNYTKEVFKTNWKFNK